MRCPTARHARFFPRRRATRWYWAFSELPFALLAPPRAPPPPGWPRARPPPPLPGPPLPPRPLPAALLLPRAHPRPTRQPGRRRKLSHVGADLRQDHLRHPPVHPRNLVEQHQQDLVRPGLRRDPHVEPTDRRVQLRDPPQLPSQQ